MNVDEKLESVLNLAPIEDEPQTTAIALVEEARKELADSNKLMTRDKVIDDLEFVRSKMREAIELGAGAMSELLALAKSSQGFEHFTAFASLMKSLNETNRNLIDLHKGAVEIETTATPDTEEKHQIDPNVIIGTQQAVMQMIKDTLGVNRGLESAAKTVVLRADDPGLQN